MLQKAVGDHIRQFVADQGPDGSTWERDLWGFVSNATENTLDGDKLQSVYQRVVGAHRTLRCSAHFTPLRVLAVTLGCRPGTPLLAFCAIAGGA